MFPLLALDVADGGGEGRGPRLRRLGVRRVQRVRGVVLLEIIFLSWELYYQRLFCFIGANPGPYNCLAQ